MARISPAISQCHSSTTANINIHSATSPTSHLSDTMRAATPQTLSWLRAIVRRELNAPTLSPIASRPSHLRLRTSAALSVPVSHASAFSTTSIRSQDSEPSSSSSTAPASAAAQSHTHYTFFPKTLPQGPPPSGPFAIDLRALRNEFIQLQAAAHPDRQPGGSDKRRAEALSARINEAYRTLQSPLLRAQHLLHLRGIDVAEDERLKVEDPELLMEVLEAREAIEEAETEEEVLAMKESNEEKINQSVAVLDKAFKEDDVETAKSEAVKLRYWVNIKDSLDSWEPGKPVVLQH
ncbi:J-type co-chaperone JAC1 [Lasiodiplodia theobromae]|uniref:J-type co-chaperone JAC1 n=1 Tax=Lasiodiplodia theobromae TaxID=45133 RepID=A0A5N5D5D0_9PEZI|nr:J-type co-chaperone JAC1 [Lasiodiplodia theobromae]